MVTGMSGTGKSTVLAPDLASVEPRLRATCTHELDATQPVGQIVETLIALGSTDDA